MLKMSKMVQTRGGTEHTAFSKGKNLRKIIQKKKDGWAAEAYGSISCA
jgi:hypothetical protein